MMSTQSLESYTATLERLFHKGVRYGTVIDVGCADGYFFLSHMQFFPGAVPLNIDASPLYEDSLKAIKEVVGGDFRISAIADHEGEIEFTESVHPYWPSVRPAGDPYWGRVNDLIKTTVRCPVTTLDALARELALKPPFLLKLDVQGAERSVLVGARDMLENCHAVICETDIDDVRAIDSALQEAGFRLYDITAIHRVQDGALGWFYPVYINRKLDDIRPRAIWNVELNDAVVQKQVERRAQILKWNTETLNRLRFGQQKVGRNEPCPCGSGRRFKHCCGAYGVTT
jgi:FkbM family methyltransferase